MDCQHENNKCDEIFGECRCYADVGTSNPLAQQRCGIRKNGYIIPVSYTHLTLPTIYSV